MPFDCISKIDKGSASNRLQFAKNTKMSKGFCQNADL